MKPTYQINQSYQWNYDHGPIFEGDIPKRLNHQPIKLWGYDIYSPIGIPAGPLLNANFVALYARLGFDLPVYKTVRTVPREAHENPNCAYLKRTAPLTEDDILTEIFTTETMPLTTSDISITNSFGIPSKSVDIWQADIELANDCLDKNQLMIVSCVGTPNLKERNIIEDYTLCAQLAAEAGAKAIELNLSCPNVVSKEGSIYQDPYLSAQITQSVKQAIGSVPVMIKIGYLQDDHLLSEVLKANAPFIDGVATINTIPMKILDQYQNQALPGQGRLISGTCGHIIHNLSVKMVEKIVKERNTYRYDFVICGSGGVTEAKEFDDFLNAGADLAMSATGAMWDPYLAYKWHKLKETKEVNVISTAS